MSPSSQRVWIEILGLSLSSGQESSPSSQRVWIEIDFDNVIFDGSAVTLFTEGVD